MQYSLKYTKDHFFFIYGKNACPFHKKSTCRLSVIAANGKTRRGKRHFLQTSPSTQFIWHSGSANTIKWKIPCYQQQHSFGYFKAEVKQWVGIALKLESVRKHENLMVILSNNEDWYDCFLRRQVVEVLPTF